MFRSSVRKNDNNSTENRHTISDMTRLKAINNETPDFDSIRIRSTPQSALVEKANELVGSKNFIYDEILEDVEEQNFVSPSVRVKHSITYEYDEKKFEINRDELLFLINKTNQDWWLCLRLDENLTFFVPASYLQELETRRQPNVQPPPRPPPPPPFNPTDRSERQTNAVVTAAAVAANTATTHASTLSSNHHKNDSSLKTKKPEVKQRQILNYSSTIASLTPENNSIENDQTGPQNRLSSTYSLILQNNDENVSPVNGLNEGEVVLRGKTGSTDNQTDDSADSIINDLDECLNREEDLFRKKDSEDIYTTVVSFGQSEKSKEIENENHIYENYPVSPPRTNKVTNRKAIIETRTGGSNGELDEDQEKKENRKLITESIALINDELEVYLNEEEDESSKSDDDILESDKDSLVKTPNGWKIAMSNDHQRKYFYNDYNNEKWYIAQDTNGTNYFYNAEGRSVWELDEICSIDDDPESDIHFRKNFDEDLGTFNNIYNRLSIRKVSNEIAPNLLNTSSEESSKTTPKMKVVSPTNLSNTPILSHRVSTGLNSNFKCVKLVEKGKKCKKKTVENYRVELASTNLLFIRESKGGVDKLELPIDFKGGKCFKVEIPRNSQSQDISNKDNNNNSSKNEKIKLQLKIGKKDKDIEELVDFIGATKNGFVIETLTGYKILIIHENEIIINDWVSEINLIISQNKVSSVGFTPIKNHDNFESELNKPVLQKLIDQRTRNIQNNSPNNSKKECVYGANLLNLCQKEKRIVPLFVEEITNEIENKGLDMDGIYRISGNLAEVQKVRHQVDQGKNNFKDFDIHVLCGAFKTFFRELEEPLIPLNLHEEFLYSINITDKPKRFDNLLELIKRMPLPHRETMRHVCIHLLKVIEQSTNNRMNVQNIALVFGPNIIRSNPINETNNGFNPNIMTQNILVEYILKNFNELFPYSSTTIFYDENFK